MIAWAAEHYQEVYAVGFWNERLDHLKQHLDLRTEFELSIVLKIHPATLGHIRSQLRPPSVANAIKILDKNGYVLTRDLFIRVLPQATQAAISHADRRRSLPLGLTGLRTCGWCSCVVNSENPSFQIDWIAALDHLKTTAKLSTEVQLAKLLQINAPALAQIRSGSRAFPAHAKINLLAELGIELDEEVLLIVFSEEIQSAVRETRGHGIVRLGPNEQDPNRGKDLDIPTPGVPE